MRLLMLTITKKKVFVHAYIWLNSKNLRSYDGKFYCLPKVWVARLSENLLWIKCSFINVDKDFIW